MREYTGASAMKVRLSGALLVLGVCVAPVQSIAQNDPFGADWPPGEGRELAGAWCVGCHSLNLVKQQGLTREGWDVLLTWMSEKQKMPPLEGEYRQTVLNYLASNFGVDADKEGESTEADKDLMTLNPVQGINHRPLLEIRPAQ